MRQADFAKAREAFSGALAVLEAELRPGYAKKGQTRSARDDPRYIAVALELSDAARCSGRCVEYFGAMRKIWPDVNDPQYPACRQLMMFFDEEYSGLGGADRWADEGLDAAGYSYQKDSVEYAFFVAAVGWQELQRNAKPRTSLLVPICRKVLQSKPEPVLNRAWTLQYLGRIYMAEGFLSEAKAALSESLDIFSKLLPKSHPDIASAQRYLAQCLMRSGQDDSVKPLLEQALESFTRHMGPDHQRIAEVLVDLGQFYEQQKQEAAAGDCYQKSVDMYVRLIPRKHGVNDEDRMGNPNHPALAQARQRLSMSLFRQGKLDAASALLLQAEKSVSICLYEAWCRLDPSSLNLRTLGKANLDAGKAAMAVDLLTIARDRERSRGAPHPVWREIDLLLAKAYHASGGEPQAAILDKEAIELTRFLMPDGEELQKLTYAAQMDEADGRYDAALEKLCRREKMIRPQLNQLLPALNDDSIVEVASAEAWWFHYMMATAIRCRDMEAAGKSLIEIDLAYKTLPSDAQASLWEYGVGAPAAQPIIRQIIQARSQLASSLSPVKTVPQLADLPKPSPSPSAPAKGRPGAPPTTEIPLQSVRSPNGESAHFTWTQPADGGPRRLARLDDSSGASYTFSYNGRDLQVSSLSVGGKLKETIHLALGGCSPLARPVGKETASIQERLVNLEDGLVKSSTAYSRLARSRQCDFASVQKALPEGTALISYMIYWDLLRNEGLQTKRNYVAVVVRKDRPPFIAELGAAEAINAECKEFVFLLANGPSLIRSDGEASAESNLRVSGGRLTSILIRPVWEQIKDCDKWIVSPDSELSVLPFGLLTSCDSDKYLSEVCDISYVTSARDVADFGQTASSRGGAIVFANPTFDQPAASMPSRGLTFSTQHLEAMSWPALPGTQTEADGIADSMRKAGVGVQLRIGAQATKASLLDVHSPQILHVATHGFFLPDPTMSYNAEPFVRRRQYDQGEPIPPANPLLFSGLAMAGANRKPDGVARGIATGLELRTMDLTGTELVTLSACETGLGSVTTGSGVRGMRQSLLQAGTRRLVTSLWKVPDAETAAMMKSFYRRLLKDQPPAAALRQAMLEVRSQRLDRPERASHPYFWGGFVLVGDPSAMHLGVSATAPATAAGK